jgi:hypothetical protein
MVIQMHDRLDGKFSYSLISTEDQLGLSRSLPANAVITQCSRRSGGIDLALVLTSLIAGEEVARGIQLAVEYDPHPTFDSGNAAAASPELKAPALRLLAGSKETPAGIRPRLPARRTISGHRGGSFLVAG